MYIARLQNNACKGVLETSKSTLGPKVRAARIQQHRTCVHSARVAVLDA